MSNPTSEHIMTLEKPIDVHSHIATRHQLTQKDAVAIIRLWPTAIIGYCGTTIAEGLLQL